MVRKRILNNCNHNLTLYPYSSGLEYLENAWNNSFIYDCTRTCPYSYTKFLAQLNNINQIFFHKVLWLIQEMRRDGLTQFVIPYLLIKEQKRNLKSFLKTINNELIHNLLL